MEERAIQEQSEGEWDGEGIRKQASFGGTGTFWACYCSCIPEQERDGDGGDIVKLRSDPWLHCFFNLISEAGGAL